MNIKIGDVVTIQHYSGLNPFRSIVLETGDGMIKLRLVKEFAIIRFFEGDPLVVGYEKDSRLYIMGCVVENIDPVKNSIEVRVDKVESDAQKRAYERYPVSLYADVRIYGENKKHLATVKDISCYGMQIYSKTEFPDNSELSMDIYLEKNVISIKANIVRKITRSCYFEYGIKIIYDNSAAFGHMNDYITVLKADQEESIVRMRNVR